MSAPEMLSREASWNAAQALGLTRREFDHIEVNLGRLPRRTEIAVFAGMWSEHCSYKSTKHLLSTLPKAGAQILAGPGSHAGVVDVGEGWGVAFKIESHNHPSAVDPYQGAATGVGGILRDIIAQGARPCAVMDALCFGMPDHGRSSHIAKGVVAGIAGYGNAFGVPNVGGNTVFDRRYEGNPLVNAMAVGLLRHDGRAHTMRTAQAAGLGNALLYVGAATGRDGVLGAAFASEELQDDNVASRPHVQVGDPFAGKKLMEACLSFTPEMGMVACQDMGASGITCATMEMAAAGAVGLEVTLDAIPVREAGMSPQEILLSESQERFMFIVAQGHEDAAVRHFQSYGVHAVICGRVTEGDRVCISYNSTVYVDLPAALVAGGAPPSEWPVASALPAAVPYGEVPAAPQAHTLAELLREPDIADPTPLVSHYDQTVGNRTVRGPNQAAAAVLKLPDSHRGFALTIGGRGEVCAAHPYLGAQAALADVCRDLACVGAPLLAITDGLNMPSPRDPVGMLKIAEVVRGLRDGLTALGVPVTGGNVSLYNESPAGPIPPTPMVGGIGIVVDVRHVPRHRLEVGDAIFLLGQPGHQPVFSRFARRRTGNDGGNPPAVDLELERRLCSFLVQQVRLGRLRAARPVGLGGMAVALAKLCAQSDCGAALDLPEVPVSEWTLFGEYPGMAWVTTRHDDAAAFVEAARAARLKVHPAGIAGGDMLVIQGALQMAVADVRRAYRGVGR